MLKLCYSPFLSWETLNYLWVLDPSRNLFLSWENVHTFCTQVQGVPRVPKVYPSLYKLLFPESKFMDSKFITPGTPNHQTTP